MARTTNRSTGTLWTALIGALLVAFAGACAPDTTEEAIEETRQEAAEAMPETETGVEDPEPVETGAGRFELILGGDVEAVREGTASCVVEAETGELRASLDPTGPSDYRYYLLVPGYERETDTYQGQFQLSGADRATGPADVGIARVEDGELLAPQLTLSFEATYAGAAGVGTAEGEVICSLPDGAEPMSDAEPEVDAEP